MGIVEPDLTRQDQKHTDAYGNPVGDCWRTALACLMEVPRDTVPHFVEECPEDTLDWWNASVIWVEEVRPGWTLICVAPDFPVYETAVDAPRTVILCGRSPRGDWQHSVLADSVNGEMVWDPFPSRAGLVSSNQVFALAARRDYE